MAMQASFPLPVRIRDRLYNSKNQFTDYIRVQLGQPPIERAPDAPDEFMTPEEVCKLLKMSRRNYGRLIAGKVREAAL